MNAAPASVHPALAARPASAGVGSGARRSVARVLAAAVLGSAVLAGAWMQGVVREAIRPADCGCEARVAPIVTLPTVSAGAAVATAKALPQRLSETGLYAPGSTTEIAPANLFYVPVYPLWSDGATKRRWIFLPENARIDASRPDSWEFPIGTRVWKEFSFRDERTETRYIERVADGSYRYATYVWDTARGDAFLAPEGGVRSVRELAEGVRHDVPSSADCRTCHEGRRSPVLGFGALQLSSDRDPFAPHREPLTPDAVDLNELARRGLLAHLPPSVLQHAPRIQAPSKIARAAAGYFFGNCAHCHNADGPLAALGLDFDQSVLDPSGYERMRSTVELRSSRFRLPGENDSRRAVPGHAERSAIWFRMHSRDAAAQMPPLGTKLVDAEGTRVVAQWIRAMDFVHLPTTKVAR